MFDQVVLRRAEGGAPVSAGQVLEALLFYQHVHLVLDTGTLFGLVRQIGPGSLLELLQRPDVSAVYCEERLATHTETIGVSQLHTFVALTLAGHQDRGGLNSPAARLQFELERLPINTSVAKSFAKRFLDKVPLRRFSSQHFSKEGIPAAARRDLGDHAFIRGAVQRIVANVPGGYDLGDSFRFEVIDTAIGAHVFHNIDLTAINHRRSTLSRTGDPITIATILSHILDARADLVLASFYGGDFITSSATSQVIRLRHEELLRRTSLNSEARDGFLEVVLPDMPALAHVVDTEQRTFGEALRLVTQAAQFKRWLKSVGPDENLLQTYVREIGAQPWIQGLPAKTLRYVFTLAAGAAHPLAGVAAEVADNFLVERFLGGWRPNHFVANKLGPFVRAER